MGPIDPVGMQTNPLADVLASIELGTPVACANLTMIPLVVRSARTTTGLNYVVLDEGLEDGLVEITEVSEEGSVPDLKLVNRGAKPVFILDGEELLGAKQNRIVNLSVMVAAQSELTIPVSCVEAGRWRARSRSFTAAPRTQYSSGRAKRMAHVSYSIAMRGDRVSDQAEVWDDIASKSVRLNAASPTSAMDAIYTEHARTLDSFVDGLPPVEGQVGAAFAIGGRVVGFDLFDSPSTLLRLLPKLVRSAAIDAIDQESEAPAVALVADSPNELRRATSDFLAVTGAAAHQAVPALGVGEDWRLTTPVLTGAALVVDSQVVHLGAFAL